MSWKLWGWQRFQQLAGALLVAVPAGIFLVYLANGQLPGNDFRRDIPINSLDQPGIDHAHIAVAIGSCHTGVSPAAWSDQWLGTLRLNRAMLQPAAAGLAGEPTRRPNDGTSQTLADDLRQEDLTSFERAAIYHSERLLNERIGYLGEAEQRQDRIRRNQLRILLLSAAGAFLVGMTTLVGGKETDAPFRSLTKGAVLPISALALLMPLLSTAMSGLVAFDDDAKIALRDQRTVAQLEQLHGRVAEDVTSDPFLCPLTHAAHQLERPSSSGAMPAQPAKLSFCVMDRMQRTAAWEQRHEQILNESVQTLARAGDLARPGDGKEAPGSQETKDSLPPGAPKTEPAAALRGDPCQSLFGAPQQFADGAR
ncbi:MAG TPA: hypothetical protein VGM32_12735 [Rhodopila sp.]|jgi:hypothetical protein